MKGEPVAITVGTAHVQLQIVKYVATWVASGSVVPKILAKIFVNSLSDKRLVLFSELPNKNMLKLD